MARVCCINAQGDSPPLSSGVVAANFYYYQVGAGGTSAPGVSNGGAGANSVFSGPTFPILASGGFGGSAMALGTAVANSVGGAGAPPGYSGDINAGGGAGEQAVRTAATTGWAGGGGNTSMGGGGRPGLTAGLLPDRKSVV